MTRTNTIRKLLQHGPLEMEKLLIIMGGDREQARADIGLMLQQNEVYLSNHHYQLNRPEKRQVVPRVARQVACNKFALHGVWG